MQVLYKRGGIGEVQCWVGCCRSLAEFVSAAWDVDDPMDALAVLPDVLLDAIADYLILGPRAIAEL
eukprot:600262-Amphidinium_carterae.1